MQIRRFCIVGGVGFLTDAGLLIASIRLAGLNPISARGVSFLVAVLVTFELNRRWSFHNAETGRYCAVLVNYLSVQIVGFVCNIVVYTLLYNALPNPYNSPLLCLAMASGLALFVNYAGASSLVFRARSAPVRGSPAKDGCVSDVNRNIGEAE